MRGNDASPRWSVGKVSEVKWRSLTEFNSRSRFSGPEGSHGRLPPGGKPEELRQEAIGLNRQRRQAPDERLRRRQTIFFPILKQLLGLKVRLGESSTQRSDVCGNGRQRAPGILFYFPYVSNSGASDNWEHAMAWSRTRFQGLQRTRGAWERAR